jgi:flagellar biosynthetic protein FliO
MSRVVARTSPRPHTATHAAVSAFHRDSTPLPASITQAPTKGAPSVASTSVSTGGAAVHMLLGLVVVLAVIYVLYKFLRRSTQKSVAGDGRFLTVVSTTALTPTRSLHLVKFGDEYVVLAASDGSVTPIRTYSADESRKLPFDDLPPSSPASGGGGFGPAILETLKRMTAR